MSTFIKKQYEYTLMRSERRTMAIYVRGGRVEVRAPLRMPERDIDRFVAAKAGWIADKLAESIERAERREAFSLDYGDSVILRGAAYPIRAQAGTRAGFDGGAFYLPPGLEPEQIRQVCVRIYRGLAKNYLPGRVALYAERMGVKPLAVRINGAKTRWGSCSAKRSVNFSWRLIMAADPLIDYVVVHELAHLTELNHSARFWAIVARVSPGYAALRKELRALQVTLSLSLCK